MKTATTRLLELGAQISAALEQLPPDADVKVRVRHGDGPALEAASIWATVAGTDTPVRRCELSAAVGMRMDEIEKALDRAGVPYPKADLRLRARWRRITAPGDVVLGYELTVHVPNGQDRPQAVQPHAPAGDA
ncbi:hypothetical protein [Promicromonospora sp. NFX87]|uniref:hypothetical protein n=1 Tax=Promicromonospora sp. NFX87 TaxID=3402691 RepID=UPI003AFB722A